MRFAGAIVVIVLLLSGLIAISPVQAQSFEWSVNIDPRDGGATIHLGDLVDITATGPDDAEIHIEIIEAGTSTVVKRFPASGTTTLVSGVIVFTWDIPSSDFGEVGALYYLTLKDSTGSVRAVMSFKTLEPSADGGDGQGNITIEEVLEEVQLLKLILNRLQRQFDGLKSDMGWTNRMAVASLALSIVAGVLVGVIAFSRRSPKLKAFLYGEKETREEKTQKELIKFLRFYLRRELPSPYGEVYVTPPQKGEAREVPEEVLPKKPGSKKWQKKYEITCVYCGDIFWAATPRAKFCPAPKNCRVKSYKAKTSTGGKNE